MTSKITHHEKEAFRMGKKIAPNEHKAQALPAVLQGQLDGQSGDKFLSTIVRLSTSGFCKKH